jgi:hypothetical protein
MRVSFGVGNRDIAAVKAESTARIIELIPLPEDAEV